MKTDLAPLFQSLLTTDGGGRYRLYLDGSTDPPALGRAEEFERCREAIRDSPSEKLRALVRCDDDLWRFTRLGVILGDVTILGGTGPIGAICDGVPDALCKKVAADAYVQRILMFYNRDILQRWIEDAEPLIRDGRVIYLANRSIMRATVTDVNVPVSNLQPAESVAIELSPDDDDWTLTLDRFEDLKNRSAAPTSSGLDPARFGSLLEVTLPILANTSLRHLHEFLQDEEDTLASFRAAMSRVISEYAPELGTLESEEEIRRVGASIRRDIMEPQLESLTRALKRIVQSRAIRLTGATLGTVALGLTAAAVQPLSATVQAVFGAGGLGIIAREYAEYRAELLALKDNPWYFAWSLRQQQSKQPVS